MASWPTVILSRFRCFAWPWLWISAHNSRTFCLFLWSWVLLMPQSSRALRWLASDSSRFSISSRLCRSRSMFSLSWLRTNMTVAVQSPRLWSFVASCKARKNLATVPWALTCILKAGAMHLDASVIAERHRVPIGLLSWSASRMYSTSSLNSWNSPDSWIWCAFFTFLITV